MRITQRAVAMTSLQGLYTNLNAVNKLQQQLTSGKAISVPSDDPTGTNTAMLTRQAIARNGQQARNISDGKTFLNATDSALQNMLDLARRARDLTVQALNTGANGTDSLNALAINIGGVRESMIGQANQVVQGRPLFGGMTTGSQAYDSAGTYVGIGGTTVPPVPVQPLTRRVSDVDAVRIDLTGPEAFGDPKIDPATGRADDLFGVVQGIVTDINDPAKLTAHLAELDTAISRMTTAAADVGTRAARLDTADQVNQSDALTLQARLQGVEGIDLPKTIMNLQMQQNGYQAALAATAQALQPTLVDFLR